MEYRNLVLFFLLALIISCSPEQDDLEEEPLEDEWLLIFEEEFEEDLLQWNIWSGGAFNEEIQLYRQEQLSLNDGFLTIHVARENVNGPTHPWDNTTRSFEYVSARIESKVLFGPSESEGEKEYRFQARIKLPSGNGMWPAFWTYGDPWPTQGEIDILEARGGNPHNYQTNIFYGTQPNVNINGGAEVEHDPGPDLTADFHTYELVWKETMLEILFDDELLYTYEANSSNNIKNLFGKQQKITLNTAVGGLFFSDRNSDNYADEAEMVIDWVRVYKK